SFGDTSQQMTGKIGNANPRQNQKTTVIDDLAEVVPTSRIVPANPLVSRSHFPGGTGKQQASQHRTPWGRGMHPITQLGAVGNAITQVVKPLDVLLEQEAVGARVN